MLTKDFLWGGAVTAHQSEGGYTEGGKLPTVCDLTVTGEFSDFKDGIDTFHRYKEDFDLYKELGFNAYRFSIDWSRMMSDEETYNEAGFEFYDQFIDELIKRDIEPIPTLYHFEMPIFLKEKYNGFASRRVVDIFVKLCQKIVDRYGHKVHKWIIFNEQNGILQKGPKMFFGAVCPQGFNLQTFDNQIMHNTLIAHSLVNEYIHSKGGYVLGMATVVQSYPETCHPLDTVESMKAQSEAYVFLDVFARGHYNSFYYANMKNEGTLPEILDGDLDILKKGITDALSISYYMSTISHYGEESLTNIKDVVIKKNPYLEMSEFGWTIDPIGLRITLRQLYDRYEMPIYIVENGFGYDDILEDGKIEDDYRIDYMRKHLEQMKQAVLEGVDCRGYLMWGPIDILSSRAQMKKRYGVVYVNRDNDDLKDMKRIKKKSFEWFKGVIKTNGEKL
ncbi:MAG: glycoside hydrolase family 1 protein [Coprobacillus sp.]|nr:glycoside hydrolase family 1 protein [Coprobacillus sp.]